jgi:hypothetical protein
LWGFEVVFLPTEWKMSAASKWFSVSFVSAEGKFKMEFNYSEAGLAFMMAAQKAAGACGFMVVEQPLHYSPWGLEQSGLSAQQVAVLAPSAPSL